MYEECEMVPAPLTNVAHRTKRSFVPIEQHHSNPTPSPPLYFYTNSSDAHSSSEATSCNSSRSVSSLSTAPQQAQTMHFAMEDSGSSTVHTCDTADSLKFPIPEIHHTVPADVADMSDIVNVLLPPPITQTSDQCDGEPSIVLGYRRDLERDTVEKQRRRLQQKQARISAKATRLMNKELKPAIQKQAATEVNDLHKLNQRLAQRWAMKMAVSHFLDVLLSKMDRPYMENISDEEDDDEIEPQYGDEGVGSMGSGEYMVECQLDTYDG